jgi:hypothetical protein
MTPVQEVLRLMVAELTDVRATLDALTKPTKTYGDALDAKKDALAAHQRAYKGLLAKIDALE